MNRASHANGPTPEAVFAYGVSPSEVIIGLDEVGRGAWAGPVTAAAVAMPAGVMIDGVNDSKKLSLKRRLEVDCVIKRSALAIGLGFVSSPEIDEYGLSWAVVESGRRALAGLARNGDRVFIDGSWNYPAAWCDSTAVVKGDSLIVPIAAASIVAKVARDRYMGLLDRRYPQYGFGAHVGYGTARHRSALTERGLTRHHRRSYRPLKELTRVND